MNAHSRLGEADSCCWSRGDLLVLGACPACGESSDRDVSYVRKDDDEAMPDTWRMVHCAACSSIYLDPRPSPDSLGSAYENYYTHQAEMPALSGSSTLARAINGYLNRRFGMKYMPEAAWGWPLFRLLVPLRMKLDVFGRHVPRALGEAGGRLLDVGCGNGTFVMRSEQMGLLACGSEPDAKAVLECNRRGLDVAHEDIFSPRWQPGYFNWITMNHVIEHVEQPRDVLARAFELLAPSGTLWMGLPNPEALGVRWLGVGWKGLHPPFHLSIPSQRVLRLWLEDAGFEDVEFVRRGMQSGGMWRESARLSRREGLSWTARALPFIRVFGDVLATLGARWSEETIVIARRSARL